MTTSADAAGEDSTVWILGAGFSKALGGPLIKQLLGPREKEVLTGVFPKSADAIAIDGIIAAGAFFRWGLDERRSNWGDAEQFLDVVESAAAESPGLSHAHLQLTKILKGIVPRPEPLPAAWGGSKFYEFDNLDELAKACRRALALDCSIFLRNAQTNSERWAPYVSWAQSLGRGHTVVTFNYDQVPELLSALPGAMLKVIDPEQVETDIEATKLLNAAPVLKVHGSVTWRLEKGADGKERIAPRASVKDPTVGDPSADPVLGVPGPGKRGLVSGSLRHLWAAALDAVRSATSVYFVGYRFPPTDADSRSKLIGALAANRNRSVMRVRTVVGPWVNDADAIRLKHLLEAAVGTESSQVRSVPLLAEDFIGLWRVIPL
jgi:hypothetical protein